MLLFISSLALELTTPLIAASPSPCADTTLATSSFAFASNPWLNLYNFLVKDAKQSRGIDDDGLGARGYLSDDTAAVRSLTPAEITAWRGAVEFFARMVVPDRMGVDSLAVNINGVLANAATCQDLEQS